MAKYVLLEFESNEQADAFIAKVQAAEKRYWLVGVFQKPRKFCECGPLITTQQQAEVTRGIRFGWHVHTVCGKVRGRWQSPRNLLDDPEMNPKHAEAHLHMGAEGLTRNHPISLLVKDRE